MLIAQPASRVPAAQYLRMSTERQNYSLEAQAALIGAYADQHGYEIVQTYADAGISGLRLNGRDALKQLLADILGGSATYSIVLVYDVSRWGRFQDPDQSAHYEFICREAGVRIEYCAEPFDNDGAMVSGIVKHLKRAMAAEYSRELSAKVAQAKRGLSVKGYWCGGVCSYGFRRCMVRADGSQVQVLADGERKALLGCRVVLVEGPEDEVVVVRRIFREFAIHGLGTSSIAVRLNANGIPSSRGWPWTRGRVHRLLVDEKYVGVLVTGRRTTRLNLFREVPEAQWLKVPGGCPALVEPWLFNLAQSNLRRRNPAGTDEELIDELRQLLERHGRLSANIIRGDGRHRPWAFIRRFGSLSVAYARAGYKATPGQTGAFLRNVRRKAGRPPWAISNEELIERLRALYAAKGRLTSTLINEAPDLPVTSVLKRRIGDMAQLWALVGCEPTRRQITSARNAAIRRQTKSHYPF